MTSPGGEKGEGGEGEEVAIFLWIKKSVRALFMGEEGGRESGG